MKTQATKYTKDQLEVIEHWERCGHKFGRDDAIPESTSIPPGKSWHWAEFAVSAIIVAVCIAWMWARK